MSPSDKDFRPSLGRKIENCWWGRERGEENQSVLVI
jgi:hypothetical protein